MDLGLKLENNFPNSKKWVTFMAGLHRSIERNITVHIIITILVSNNHSLT